jgi:trk system potassium uptake protein TrkA
MKSVLIIGMGRMGRHLAAKMQKLGNDVLIVDSNRDAIDALSEQFTDANICDCTNENVIRALGVDNFDICFVTIGEDFQASLVITSLLKKHGARKIVAKANQEIQADLLRTIGADEIVNAEEELAEYLAVRYNSDNIFDYVPLTDEYSMYELPVPAPWVGKTPVELDIRRKHHINIIGVKNGRTMNPNLGGDYRFRSADHILVIGKFNEVVKISEK